MAAKMAAETVNLMYLDFSFQIQRQISVDSYEVKVVEYEYVKIHNDSRIFSKMASKMAADELKMMYLSSPFRYKDK